MPRAIAKSDTATLLRLTDRDFHVFYSYGSAFQNFTQDIEREQWIASVSSRRLESYAIDISGVRTAGPNAVYVSLNELLTIRSPDGGHIQQ